MGVESDEWVGGEVVICSWRGRNCELASWEHISRVEFGGGISLGKLSHSIEDNFGYRFRVGEFSSAYPGGLKEPGRGGWRGRVGKDWYWYRSFMYGYRGSWSKS